MTILALDDEKIALEGLVKSIEKAVKDAEVSGFRKGELALEFAKEHPIDVAFLDIEMRGENGLEIAEKLKEIHPRINIIFTTGYSEYANDAFLLRASGYVMKPVTPEKIAQELKELRFPPEHPSQKRVSCKTFGNFEIFIDGAPVKFQYNKSREFFAFLVDRNGALVSNQDIIANLWDDENADGHMSYLKNMRGDLLSAFEKAGCVDVFVRQHGRIGIRPESIDCDYFRFLDGEEKAREAYTGEYMSQYSWAEYTNGALQEAIQRNQGI